MSSTRTEEYVCRQANLRGMSHRTDRKDAKVFFVYMAVMDGVHSCVLNGEAPPWTKWALLEMHNAAYRAALNAPGRFERPLKEGGDISLLRMFMAKHGIDYNQLPGTIAA